MKIYFCILSLFFSSSQIFAKNLSFEDLKTLLPQKNGTVIGSTLEEEAAVRRKGVLKRSFLPKLNFQIGRERFTTGPYINLTQTYGVAALSVNLFNGGKDSLKDEVINAEARLAAQKKVSVTMDHLTETRVLYWEAVSHNEILNILKQSLELNDKNLSLAKKKINAGLSSPTDTLDFQQFHLLLRQQTERSAVTLYNVKAQLKAALALETEVELQNQNVPHQHNDLSLTQKLDVNLHRDIQSLSQEKEITQNQSKLQKRWWTPEVDAYGAYSLFTQKERDYSSRQEREDKTVGVVLKMNLFDGGDSYTQAQSNAIKVRAIESAKHQRSLEISTQLENSKRVLQMAHDLVHLAEENVETAQIYFQRTLKEYEKGVKNTPDVLQASSRYIDAKVKFVELRRDYQLARVDVLNSLGE